MDQYEYCLLWASPRKTIVIRPGGHMEKFTRNSRSRGILADLQADGWQTVAFDMEPTADMTYLFQRRVQGEMATAKDRPFSKAPVYPYAPAPNSQHGISPQ